MTYATEFFAVQNALGFSNKSCISSAPFKALDEQYKQEGRLQDLNATYEGSKIRAILVDGKMIRFECDGSEMNVDPNEVLPLFS